MEPWVEPSTGNRRRQLLTYLSKPLARICVANPELSMAELRDAANALCPTFQHPGGQLRDVEFGLLLHLVFFALSGNRTRCACSCRDASTNAQSPYSHSDAQETNDD